MIGHFNDVDARLMIGVLNVQLFVPIESIKVSKGFEEIFDWRTSLTTDHTLNETMNAWDVYE